jgi:hypothetical protein
MGKGVLIVVLGLSVIITIMIINLNANANASTDTTVDFFKKTKARLVANSGIEMYLEKLRRNKTLSGTFTGNSFGGGDFTVSIYGPDTLLKIKSVATFMNYTHTSIATAKRTPVQMPQVNSALYISSSNIDLHLNGNVDIQGYDYNMNGTLGSATALPGVGVDLPADSAYVVDDLSRRISQLIKGSGVTPSVYTVPYSYDWKAITEAMIFSADTVIGTGTYSGGAQFGTQSKPIITYANGNVDFTDATGYGIMVVNGNINLSGNFNFYGILIAYGQTTIRTQTIGNNAIYGGTILVGENVSLESQGNAKFYYSNEAIENAQVNLKSSRFDILDWWE